VSDLLLRNDLFLRENLHSIYSLCIAFPDLENLAKSAASDQFEELKVAWRKRAFGLSREIFESVRSVVRLND
jgi:hypothetical protein